jgi:hypothetical protein
VRFETVDPVLPAGFDLLWSLAVLLLVALAAVALVQVARSDLAGRTKVFAAIVIVVAAVVGPIAWLVLRPDHAQSRSAASAPPPSRTIHNPTSA